jgi:hypothetical protein
MNKFIFIKKKMALAIGPLDGARVTDGSALRYCYHLLAIKQLFITRAQFTQQQQQQPTFTNARAG